MKYIKIQYARYLAFESGIIGPIGLSAEVESPGCPAKPWYTRQTASFLDISLKSHRHSGQTDSSNQHPAKFLGNWAGSEQKCRGSEQNLAYPYINLYYSAHIL